MPLSISPRALSRWHCIKMYCNSFSKVARHESNERVRQMRPVLDVLADVCSIPASHFRGARANPSCVFSSLVTLKDASARRCCNCEQVESLCSLKDKWKSYLIYIFVSFLFVHLILFIYFFFSNLAGYSNGNNGAF